MGGVGDPRTVLGQGIQGLFIDVLGSGVGAVQGPFPESLCNSYNQHLFVPLLLAVEGNLDCFFNDCLGFPLGLLGNLNDHLVINVEYLD